MKSFFKPLLAVCSWHLLAASVAPAATHVWSGNGINDLFTTAANWSAGGVPAVGETGTVLLQFPANPGSLTPLDNIPGLVVDGVTFAGGNYNLRGSGGATLTLRRAAASAFSIVCTASAGLPNKIEATLPLVIASTTRVHTDFVLNLDSTISGIGGLKIEGGDVHLRGTTSNTYAFTTTVTESTLWLEKSNGVACIGGDLLVALGGVVRQQADYQLGLTEKITLGEAGYEGIYIMADFTKEDLPNIHFEAGDLWLPAHAGAVLNGVISVSPRSGIIYGHLGLKAPMRTLDIAGTLWIDATVADGSNLASGIQKLGAGSVYLNGPNTFSGNVSIEQGRCAMGHSSALGTGAGTTTVNQGAILLSLSASALTIQNETLNLAGELYGYVDIVWTGPIVLTGDACHIGAPWSGLGLTTFTHTGVISGTGKLTKAGISRLLLQGAAGNTYSGGTLMQDGELFLGKSAGNAIPGDLQIDSGSVFLTNNNQIASTAGVAINGGVLNMGLRTNTIGLLSGTGGEIQFALGTLTTGGAGSSTWSGLLSGNGVNSLIKQGTGTFTLNNAANGGDTLTGAILVNQGTLQMNGLHPGPITVSIAGQLSGSGTLGIVNVQGGKISLSALKTNNLNINGGGSQAITEISFAKYGHIAVTGPVNLTQSALSASLTYVPYAGSNFMLVENDGMDAIIGTFSGLPEGSPVIFGTQIFNISYHGGTGNDVVLTLVSGGLPPLSIDKFTSSPVPGNPGANAVLIEATGQPGVLHLIESSGDLIYWNVINNIPASTDAQGHSSTSFLDDNPARRFYRVKEVAL